MRRRMMKSKIHRATVTDANLDYIGSITIDRDLMNRANLLEFEQVAVVDIDNGARLETYVIEGEPGSGEICLNGAAAHLVHPGHKIIVISYGDYDDTELQAGHRAVVRDRHRLTGGDEVGRNIGEVVIAGRQHRHLVPAGDQLDGQITHMGLHPTGDLPVVRADDADLHRSASQSFCSMCQSTGRVAIRSANASASACVP